MNIETLQSNVLSVATGGAAVTPNDSTVIAFRVRVRATGTTASNIVGLV